MANVEITGLPAVVTPATTDVLAVDQGGVTKKETVAQILTNLDGYTGNVDITGTLDVSSTADIGGDTTIDGDLTVSWGGSGTPVAGWLNDGTPYYKKEISVTIANGTTSGYAAHGISNAYSSDKIINVIPRRTAVSTSVITYDSGSSGANVSAIMQAYWDDTNLTLSREGSTSALTYTVLIEYI